MSAPSAPFRLAPLVAAAILSASWIVESAAQANDAATVVQISNAPTATIVQANPTPRQAPISRLASPRGPAGSPALTQQIDLCRPDTPRSSQTTESACSKLQAKGDNLSDASQTDSLDSGDDQEDRPATSRTVGSAPNADVIANRLRTGDVQTSAVADSVGVGFRTANPAPPATPLLVVPR